MNLKNFLSGKTILEKIHSEYNGEIEVIRDFTWGTYIQVNGLTQSGGILTKVWQQTLKKILKIKPHIDSCLILGLGGGSAANLVAQYWVGAKITGIDIDKKMVDLGKKYFNLTNSNIKVKIQDAYNFDSTTKYDLILVDLYNGDKFPEKFGNYQFLKKVKNSLNVNGIAIFNRLYGSKYKAQSLEFAKKLEKVFQKVDHILPQANIQIICYN